MVEVDHTPKDGGKDSDLRKCECGSAKEPEYKSTAYEYRYIECPECQRATGGFLSVFEAKAAWNAGEVE